MLSSGNSHYEALGIVVGGEFKAAYEAARLVGADVILGDQDMDVTMKRLAAALWTIDLKRYD